MIRTSNLQLSPCTSLLIQHVVNVSGILALYSSTRAPAVHVGNPDEAPGPFLASCWPRPTSVTAAIWGANYLKEELCFSALASALCFSNTSIFLFKYSMKKFLKQILLIYAFYKQNCSHTIFGSKNVFLCASAVAYKSKPLPAVPASPMNVVCIPAAPVQIPALNM